MKRPHPQTDGLRLAARRGDIQRATATRQGWIVVLVFLGLLAIGYFVSTVGQDLPQPAYGLQTRKPQNAPNQVLQDPCGLNDVVCPQEAQESANLQKSTPSSVPPEVKEAISEACQGEIPQCVKDLTALCLKESHCNPNALNQNSNGTTDGGAFQINSIHHFADRMNPKAAAIWTLARLKANGWPLYRTLALGSHHSYSPALARPYAESVKHIAESL